MQNGLKQQFAEKWERFFRSASLPICLFYTNDEQHAEPVKPYPGMHCLIRELARVRAGESLSFASRAVLGMFDVSARPWVPSGELTLAIPWPKFLRMVSEMDESFLVTESWGKVMMRISPARS